MSKKNRHYPAEKHQSGIRKIIGISILSFLIGSILSVTPFVENPIAAEAAPVTERPATGHPKIIDVAASSVHVLALEEDGKTLWGWGTNANREVSGGSTTAYPQPVLLAHVTSNSNSPLNKHLLPDPDKTRYPYDGNGVIIPEIIIQVAVTDRASFALTNYGRIISWGADTYGELGRATSASYPGFVTRAHTNDTTAQNIFYGDKNASSVNKIVEIVAGRWHILARTDDGRVYSWGWNGGGNLGNGNTTTLHVPFQIPESYISGATMMAAGYSSSVVVANMSASNSTKVIKAWGSNANSRLAVGTSATNVLRPTNVVTNTGLPTGNDILQIAASNYAIFALDARNNGSVWSWGDNSYSVLARTTAANLPYRVQSGTNAGNTIAGVAQISAANYTVSALQKDTGRIRTWGYNGLGQLGQGNKTNQPYPVWVKNFDKADNLSKATKVVVGLNSQFIISEVTFQDGFGELSMIGQNQINAQSHSQDFLVPNLVWKYQHTLNPIPAELLPPELSDGSSSWVSRNTITVGIYNPATQNGRISPSVPSSLSHLAVDQSTGEGGKLRYSAVRQGINLESLSSTIEGSPLYTAESTENIKIPIQISTGSNCSYNATTKVFTPSAYGYYGTGSPASGGCYFYRQAAETPYTKAIDREYIFIVSGRDFQSIASFHSDEADAGQGKPKGLFNSVNADTPRIALPRNTDAPAGANGIVYQSTTPEICQVELPNGAIVTTQTTAQYQLYLRVLGEGECTVTANQPGKTYYYEAISLSETFTITAGKAQQSLTVPGRDNFRYNGHSANSDLPTGSSAASFELPNVTTAGGQFVSYQLVGTGNKCLLTGTTLTATGAGKCEIRATAPGVDTGNPASPGFLAFAEIITIEILKGIQTLETEGLFDELTTAAASSDQLPSSTDQGVALNWTATRGANHLNISPVCQIAGSAGSQYVQAQDDGQGDSWDPDETPGPECSIEAKNAGNSNWEPYGYLEVVTIDSRGVQNVVDATGNPLAEILKGKKFGDAPVTLPEFTSPGGQVISYSTSSAACIISDRTVTFVQGGDCLVTATADGVLNSDPNLAWRPYSSSVSNPISKTGQYVENMPSFAGYKAGQITASLPERTVQNQSVTWSVSPVENCVLVHSGSDVKVNILSDGECTVTGSALATTQFEAFSYTDTFSAAINYDELIAEHRLNANNALKNKDEAIWTEHSWQAYFEKYNVASSMLPDQGGTQAAVDSITAALKQAREELVDYHVLKKDYENRDVDESRYTPDSWAEYLIEVAKAEELLAKAAGITDPVVSVSQAEIDAQDIALEQQRLDLVLRADFSLLELEYSIRNDFVETNFTSGSWAAYQQKLAQVVTNPLGDSSTPRNNNATQSIVDSATAELAAARNALVDVSPLRQLVNSAQSLYTPAADFDNEPENGNLWDSYQSILATAESVLGNANSTANQVTEALSSLQDAISNLRRTKQHVEGLPEALELITFSGNVVSLPAQTIQGSTVTYFSLNSNCVVTGNSIRAVAAGECEISWTAPAIPHETDPALTWVQIGHAPGGNNPDDFERKLTAPVGAALLLYRESVRVSDGISVLPESEIRIVAAGLAANSILRVEVSGVEVDFGTITADADGKVDTLITIPAELDPADYVLLVQGTRAIMPKYDKAAEISIDRTLAFTLKEPPAPPAPKPTPIVRPGNPVVVVQDPELPEYPAQEIIGLEAGIFGLVIGGNGFQLPVVTDRGGEVSYTATPSQICRIEDGVLYRVGVGVCQVSWSAPFVKDPAFDLETAGWPELSGSISVGSGPGIKLEFAGLEIKEGATFTSGDLVELLGSGLLPGSQVLVELHSDPIVLANVTVGNEGGVRIPIEISSEVPVGKHTLKAFATSLGGEALSDEVAIEILANPDEQEAGDWSWLLWSVPVGALALGLFFWIVVRKRRGEHQDSR